MGELVVLDVKGVGYGILVPADDFSKLSVGDISKLYIYEHIREVSHDLYGFLDFSTKLLFEQLLGVNGVGPKMAINILGVGSPAVLKQAIASGDTKLIQTASGVGKKVAERVVIELKEKVGLIVSDKAELLLIGTASSQNDEAVQALMALGYTFPDAAGALAGIDKKIPTEDRVKQALRGSAL